jgi:ASC-1-like (ASCH) protein
MATFEASTHPLAFAHMEGGMKTVFAMPYSDEFAIVSSGDRIEFDDLGSITVGMVRRYPSLSDLMGVEGFDNVVPEADGVEKAIEILEASDSWNATAVAQKGVFAFRVRWAKRKS